MKKRMLMLACGMSLAIHAQDVLNLTQDQAEALLLENNLLIMAEQLNISKATAAIYEAKLWDNPTLTVDEINLWTTPYQRRTGEEQSTLFGSDTYGTYQQISAQLEQVIKTAGKRRKMIAITKVEKDMAEIYFKELLLNLKQSFRNNMYTFEYLSELKELTQNQETHVKQLYTASEAQLQLGNISKNELLRLKAYQIQLQKQILDYDAALSELKKEFALLLNVPIDTDYHFLLTDTDVLASKFINKEMLDYQEQLPTSNTAIALATKSYEHSEKSWLLEKANKTPDVTFSVGYDRGGNILKDFIGVGIAIDLPVLNTNKRAVEIADYEMKQTAFEKEYASKEALATLSTAYNTLKKLIDFKQEAIDDTYLEGLEQGWNAYLKNYNAHTISMVAFLDYVDAYMDHKTLILETNLAIENAYADFERVLGTSL